MNTPILLDPNNETMPVIRTGDYEFCWTMLGLVAVTNNLGVCKFYSIEALTRLERSTGMPKAVRAMASAALAWAEAHEGDRS